MIEGFCVGCKTDRPVDADRRCTTCDHVSVPPTWGRRDWRWEGGTWVPYTPRPDDHRWVMPKDEQPKPRRATARPTRPVEAR